VGPVSGFLWLLGGLAYVSAYTVAAGLGARWLARRPYCHKGYSYRKTCQSRSYPDPADCWRSDGDASTVSPSNVAVAGAAALVWPLLLPLVAAWLIATRPGRSRPDTAFIARMEREMRIGGSS